MVFEEVDMLRLTSHLIMARKLNFRSFSVVFLAKRGPFGWSGGLRILFLFHISIVFFILVILYLCSFQDLLLVLFHISIFLVHGCDHFSYPSESITYTYFKSFFIYCIYCFFKSQFLCLQIVVSFLHAVCCSNINWCFSFVCLSLFSRLFIRLPIDVGL